MDISKKKVMIIPLDGTLTDGGGLTFFNIRREVLDRIRRMNIARIVIIIGDSDDKDFMVKVRAVEFFVFSYCRTAVYHHHDSGTLLDDIMAEMPHNLRRKEQYFSVGDGIDGIDNMTLEEFIR